MYSYDIYIMENSNDNKISRKGIFTKANQFKKEREDVIVKLNDILNIKGDKTYFWLDEIDETKKKAIDEIGKDIRKYFVTAQWSYYKNIEVKDRHMSLVKSIFRDMGYNVTQNIQYRSKNLEKTSRTKISIEKQQ